MIEVPVLVIGAGPVGLSIASELGLRKDRCLVVEERTAVTNHPKATLLGSRSMEFFRRWGIVDEVLRAGLPIDNTYDVIFCTRLRGWELFRYSTPPTRDIIARKPETMARLRELQWSPYFKTQIGQQALEPVLRDFAGSFDCVDLRYGWRFDDYEADEGGVTARLVETSSGREETVRARFLVGCDGGSSRVRRGMGARYVGRGAMRPNVSFFFRSTEFLKKHGLGHGNLYFIYSPDSFGVFTAINGRDLWNYQYYFLDKTRETREVDPRRALFAAMGAEFEFELLHVMHWHHHQSVATRFRDGNVFIAGDSAHLFSPTGGVGMNTGIGDAVDLAWKLSAVLNGWGGEALLASYERERKPVAVRNTMTTANNADRIDMVMNETPSEVEEDSPRGEAVRHEIAQKLKWVARQFNSAGLHLGYRYYDSPVIVPDGTPEPPDDTQMVVPSTWPGMRAPHAWLEDGRTTLDLFRGRFTLVTGVQGDGAGFLDSAGRNGVPAEIAACSDPGIQSLYERPLVLVRPDGHVCWRGSKEPEDWSGLLRTVCGRG